MEKQERILDLEAVLTVADAAALVGRTRQTIYILIREKAVESVQVGSIYMVNRNDLLRIALERGWIHRKGS